MQPTPPWCRVAKTVLPLSFAVGIGISSGDLVWRHAVCSNPDTLQLMWSMSGCQATTELWPQISDKTPRTTHSSYFSTCRVTASTPNREWPPFELTWIFLRTKRVIATPVKDHIWWTEIMRDLLDEKEMQSLKHFLFLRSHTSFCTSPRPIRQ